MLNHPNSDLDRLQQEGSPLLKRQISSSKGRLAAINNLAPADVGEIVKETSDKGRVMFPAQRGRALYKRLLQFAGITAWPSQAWDFTDVEADAGVGELMAVAVGST